jgi:sec-independent protein translocase protein TatB
LFDIAFSELVLIAIVALIVIGPEKLPRVARTLGALVGRMQRYVANVKHDIERELELDELQKLQQDIQRGSHALKSEVENTIQSNMSGVKQAAGSLEENTAQAEAKPAKTDRDNHGV